MSTENTQRRAHGQRIDDGTGQTDETFHGGLWYARRGRPNLVICEYVSGLLKRNRSCDAQIYSVRAAFEELGYYFERAQLVARSFLLPQQCTRAWMWAIRSDIAAAPAAGQVTDILAQLSQLQPLGRNIAETMAIVLRHVIATVAERMAASTQW
ncbi:MAG: hypothetical protein ACKPKO_03530, partial [Candidatus Fonsibacter sp.]